MSDAKNEAAFSGLRALDLTDMTGYLSGMLLGELGVDVIKVEPPLEAPRKKKRIPLHARIQNPEQALYWYAFNHDKRAVTIDLETNSGRQVFEDLAKRADFIIESFPPGHMARLGLDYEALSKLNPKLIMTSITPFGQTGPYHDYKGYDITSVGMGGMLYSSGDADRPPIYPPVGLSYGLGSVMGTVGTLMAYLHRIQTGDGQHVDVSIQESLVRSLGLEISFWDFQGDVVKRYGKWRRLGKILQRYIWPCKDGFVNWQFFGGSWGARQVQALVEWMQSEGVNSSLKDKVSIWPTIDLNTVEQNEVDTWEEALLGFLSTRTRAYLRKEAVRRGILLAPLNTIEDIAKDEHLKSRGFWSKLPHPESKEAILYPGPFYHSTQAMPDARSPAPLIGDHNEPTSGVWPDVSPGDTIEPEKDRVGNLALRKGLFDGLKVLDFSTLFAGPTVGSWLGDFGAKVIKMESNSHLDLLRMMGPYKDGIPGMDRGGVFAFYNESKYSMTVDLNTKRGIEIVKELAGWADIILENFRPGTIEKWGLSFADLKSINKDIILVSLTNQGRTGISSAARGIGANISALTGLSYLVRWPDRTPAGLTNPVPDWIQPTFTMVAILAALEYRRKTGKGQHIDISQYETTALLLAPYLLDYFVNASVLECRGNKHPYAAPHGVYRCKGEDEWCTIAVFTEEEWKAFCTAIGRPHLAQHQGFATLADRKRNEKELDEIVEAWTIDKSSQEVMEKLQKAGVAGGRVKSNRDLFEDPQLASRGFFQPVEHPILGTYHWTSWPFRLPKVLPVPKRTPCLGEHTHHVCTEILGMSDAEFIKGSEDEVLR